MKHLPCIRNSFALYGYSELVLHTPLFALSDLMPIGMRAMIQALAKVLHKRFRTRNLEATQLCLPPDSSGALHQLLEALGEDATLLAFLPHLSLYAKRSLACTDRWLHAKMMSQLLAPELAVTADDATWSNAIFLDRLPYLRVLRVDNRALNIEHMRLQLHVNIVGLGESAAFFLGAVLGGHVHVFELAARILDAEALRTCKKLDARSMPTPHYGMLIEADVELMRGIMWRNQHLNLHCTLEALRKMQMSTSDFRQGPYARLAAFVDVNS